MLATRVIVITTVRTALALSSAYAGWTIAQRADAFVGALDVVFRESIVRFGIALPCDCLPGARTSVTLGHEALSSIPALGAVGCCCIYALLYTRKDVGIAKDT